MRIIRAADCRRMPWKNGGGETTEIAVSPPVAGLDDFDWRLSMARVESSGPFSMFPGIDRTLAILDGEGIILHVEDRIPFGLTGKSDPLPFPADVPTRANLVAGAVTDLNMMTRRGRRRHSVERIDFTGSSDVDLDASEILLFCHFGSIRVLHADESVLLNPLDTIHIEHAQANLRLEADGRAALFLILIEADA
ncbi:MAG: HutD family protein [Pseudaminobacter sp.]|nr:HutD family protein [Pseudaminobacter sp.]